MPAEELQLTIEITCTNLPGLLYEERGPLHLGIQQDEAIIETAPADAKQIVFRPTVRVRKQPDGTPNFLGPFVHGPCTERFIIKDKKIVERVGRIKLHLNHIEFDDVEKNVKRNKPLKVALRLTSDKNKPVFASVRANEAQWQL
jgi:hypothetical protein